MKYITVIVEVEVPDNATDEDITQWVDVEFGECNSMASDNPIIDNYEIFSARWKRL